jgi:hypothetical protein
MMRRLGLSLLLWVIGCSHPAGTSVRVTVTGSVPVFDHLAIKLSAGGTVRMQSITQSSIPPDIVFAVEVPRSVAGPLHVEVGAVDAGGITLVSAADDAPLQPGEIRDLKLTLSVGVDAGPSDDLTVIDLSVPSDMATAPPDLKPAVPMVVNLAGARPIPTNVTGARSFVDLNKDGKLDILDTSTAQFTEILNRGDGVFLAPSPFPRTSLQPAIDLNGDGLPDFVGYTSTTVTVSLNDGMGRYPLTGTNYVTDGTIYSVVLVDLNKDKRPDILTYISVVSGPQIQVFLNNGMGVFTKKAGFDTQASNLIATPDLTGDGAPEIFETWNTAADWHSFINNGSGGFAPSPSPAGTLFNNRSPADIFFKDMDGDKKDDAVVRSSNQVLVALSNGDGSFAGQTTSTLATTISGLTFADLSGDGKLDVVGSFASNTTLQVLINNGSGVLPATPATLTAGAIITSFQLADLNNDSRPDVVVLEGGGTVEVFLNNGNGTFATRVPYVVNNGAPFPTLLDVNNDTFLDILTVLPTGFGVRLNDKSGAFPAKVDTTTPTAALFVDVTGDGIPDAVGAGGTGNQVWYSKNDGNGGFGTAVSVAMNGLFTPTNLTTADLTGDGVADIIGSISYVATTSGAPDLPAMLDSSAAPVNMVIGDFLVDGKPDVVAVFGNSNVGRFMNMGGFSFAAEADSTCGTTGSRVAAGHIKSPTSLDLVVANTGSMDVSMLAGRGDGSFDPKMDYPIMPAAVPNSLAVADLDHDTYDDLAIGLSTGNVGILLNNKSGVFSPKNDYAGTASLDLLWADLTTDQRPELITVSAMGVQVLVNDGTGKFASKTDYFWTGVTLSMARLIDRTGGGQLDVVASVTPPTNGLLSMRTNSGGGAFAMPADFVTDGTRFAFGDLNRDGRVDLVTTFANTLRVLIQDATGKFQPGNEYYLPAPAFLEIADFDGDGLGDVICGGGSIGTHLVVLKNVSR